MPVPKKKTTRAKRGKRRAHVKLIKPVLVLCPHCKKSILPHRICPYCGWYKGKEVMEIKVKKGKKKKREKGKKAEKKKE